MNWKKMSLTAIAVFCSLAAQEKAPTHLVDNFDTRAMRSHDIFTSSDSSWDNGKSSISFSFKDDNTRYISFTYSLDKGEYEWEPYTNLNLKFHESFDADEFDGFRYRYKGAAHAILFETRNIRDYSFYEAQVSASDEWRTVDISFERDVRQPEWGEPKPFAKSVLQALNWQVKGETGDSGSVCIDDIEFVRSMPYVQQNNMEINEPIVPKRIAAQKWGKLNTVQKRAQKYLSRTICLHNWLEEDEKWDGVFEYDRAMIKKYADQGFNAIRFPIDLDKWVVDRDEVVAGTKPFSLDSTLFSILDSMALWTKENGQSLTIDYHQYDKSLNRETVMDRGYIKMVSNLWKSVAHYYEKEQREDLFFELTNEPGIMDDISNTAWRIMAKEMLDSIRTVNTFNSVIYGDSRWYDRDKLITSDVFAPEDGNVIYAFHYYDPFIFTHQGADWAGNGTTGNVPFPYAKERWSTEYIDFGISDGTEEWVKESFDEYYKTGNANTIFNDIAEVKNWAVTHNLPVICNEMGVYEKSSQLEDRQNWFKAVGEIFAELEMGYGIWFGTFDENEDLIPGIAKAMGLNE